MRRVASQVAFLAVIGIVGGSGRALAIDLLDECREFRPMSGILSKQIERPKAPYCAMSFLSFTGDYQFQSCKREMLEYQAVVERYGKCLEQENSEVVSEFNAAVESFNRLASQ